MRAQVEADRHTLMARSAQREREMEAQMARMAARESWIYAARVLEL